MSRRDFNGYSGNRGGIEMVRKPHDADIIGGFPVVDPNCAGCGKPLVLENAWMTDGCPCNTALGVNSMNETRWRLLMELQQVQSRALSQIEELTFGGKGESAVHVIASAACRGVCG